jgi:hypothetical protein
MIESHRMLRDGRIELHGSRGEHAVLLPDRILVDRPEWVPVSVARAIAHHYRERAARYRDSVRLASTRFTRYSPPRHPRGWRPLGERGGA